MNTATHTQSLKRLAQKVHIESTYGAHLDYNKQDDWQQKSNGWHCTLKYQGRRYSFDFWQGQAITAAPDVIGTLDCLLSDAHCGEQDFDEFCRDMGYDQDSREAEKTWKDCQKINAAMKRLLGDDYESFLYADRS